MSLYENVVHNALVCSKLLFGELTDDTLQLLLYELYFIYHKNNMAVEWFGLVFMLLCGATQQKLLVTNHKPTRHTAIVTKFAIGLESGALVKSVLKF